MAKHLRTLLGLILGFLFCDSAKADILPVEHFTRLPAYSQAMLSPDGDWVAIISPDGDYTFLKVLNLETKKSSSVVGDIGVSGLATYQAKSQSKIATQGKVGPQGNVISMSPVVIPKTETVTAPYSFKLKRQIGSFLWTGDQNLIASGNRIGFFQSGLLSYFVNSRETYGLTWRYSDPDWIESYTVLDPLVDDADSALLLLEKADDDTTPSVIKMNLQDRKYELLEDNPGDVLEWVTDSSGNIRVCLVKSEQGNFIKYRQKSSNEWIRLAKLERKISDIHPLFIDENDSLFIGGKFEDKNYGIFEIDLISGKSKQTVILDDQFDVLRGNFATDFDGMPLEGLIVSVDRTKALGVKYYSNVPKVIYWDPVLANIQEQMNQAFPNSINLIKNVSRDGTKILILSYSATNPGDYYRLDRDTMKMEFLISRMPWIEPEKMSMTYPVSFKADDGMNIYGYRNDPQGKKPENLPLVVIPRSDLGARLQWEFDPLVQFLANRGYGVLQIDYRGASGYGTDYFHAGYDELNENIPKDIIAGVNWAIQSGYANPEKIALVGSNFGVTTVLSALGESPELFRSAVVINGIYNWESILKLEKSTDYKYVFKFWMGDLKNHISDKSILSDYSPLESLSTIKIPILLIHNEENKTYPVAAAKKFARKLKSKNKSLKKIFLTDEENTIFTQNNRNILYRSLESFLQESLKQ